MSTAPVDDWEKRRELMESLDFINALNGAYMMGRLDGHTGMGPYAALMPEETSVPPGPHFDAALRLASRGVASLPDHPDYDLRLVAQHLTDQAGQAPVETRVMTVPGDVRRAPVLATVVQLDSRRRPIVTEESPA